VSHDRYFLEGVATEVCELNKAYPDGVLRFSGNYSNFLERKGEYLAAQSKRQEALENRVRVEKEWLRRGPKARTTKSKARIDKANDLIGELGGMRTRSQTATAGIDFVATDRQTKRLVEFINVDYSVDGRKLIRGLNFPVTAGMRVGLVGPNGSGKTTLLRLLRGEIEPESGEIKRANLLRTVYFDQNRVLDGDQTLRRALAPDSDSVVYQDRVIHVASWASRFLFTGEQLNQPVERLSGGERARVLIANLMLQPADLLLLDEPTNDLDIPTLEILEESLLEYPGALMLVTHDRFMLDRVSTTVLGLDGLGNVEHFADYGQWEEWQVQQLRQESGPSTETSTKSGSSGNGASSPSRKKLSYLEVREYSTLEQRVEAAEELLQACREAIEDPTVAIDAVRLQKALKELDDAQNAVDALYIRWAELEAKRT
jgi:ATP-binding cassette subfamily F protein uup